MTNTLTISREHALRLIKGDASKGANALQLIDAWKAMDELRALLAAPAVERQDDPVMKLEAERLLEGDGEYSVSFVKSGWLDECRKTGGTFFLFTSPPAPVAVDERAEFEVWVRKELPGIVIDLAPIMGFYKGDDGPRLDDMFSAWQARACLDKVKEMNR